MIKGKKTNIKGKKHKNNNCYHIKNQTLKRQINAKYNNKNKICCNINIYDGVKHKSKLLELTQSINKIIINKDNNLNKIINTFLLINKINRNNYVDFKELDFYKNEKKYLERIKKENKLNKYNYFFYSSDNISIIKKNIPNKNNENKILNLNNILYPDNIIYLNNTVSEFINIYSSNIKILLLHPNTKYNSINDKIIDFLEYDDNIKIICNKNIYLSYNSICSLNFMIFAYDKIEKFTNIQKISNLQGYISKNKIYNDLYLLKCIVIYDIKNNINTINDLNLNNKGLNINNKELNINNNSITLLKEKQKIIEISKTLFNENSLQFLDEQRLLKFSKIFSGNGYNYLNKIKKYFANNIIAEDRDRFIITGGGLFFIYGLRKPEDLDFIINKYPTNKFTNCFNELIAEDFINEKTKIKEWDTVYPELKWKEFYKDFHTKWANYVGAFNILECIINPKYHMYYMGLKFITLDLEIYRRNARSLPSSIADIIAVNDLLNKNYKINKIDKKYYITYPKDNTRLISTNKQKFINTIKYKLKTRFGIVKKKDDIKKIVKFN
jgi:hypothetical protein